MNREIQGNSAKLTVLILIVFIILTGCKDGSTDKQETTYQKRNQTLAIETEPASFRKYALVSSGNINVETNFTTDGPLQIFTAMALSMRGAYHWIFRAESLHRTIPMALLYAHSITAVPLIIRALLT